MNISAALYNASIVLISAYAAVMDIKSWRISNLWLLFWFAAGAVYEISFFGGENMAGKLVGAMIPAALLGFFFVCRMLGAGDIKLFCTLGIWLGAEGILMCMLFSFAIGAAISFVMLAANKIVKERFYAAGKYFAELAVTRKIRGYGVKKAGKARVNVAVFAFWGVMLKIVGIY